MKLADIFEGIDHGDHAIHHSVHQAAERRTSAHSMSVKGFWLVDRASGKKLSGPYKSADSAESFKKNRKDKIPADAKVIQL